MIAHGSSDLASRKPCRMSPNDPSPILASRIAILAVVVVYERALDEVEAWPALRSLLGHGSSETGPQLEHLLIYDNTALPRAKPAASVARCTYMHNPNNGGTAAAYAHATRLAIDLGLPWLLLLDHDTLLPTNFLAAAAGDFEAAARQPTIAALVPMVRHRHGELVSPVW